MGAPFTVSTVVGLVTAMVTTGKSFVTHIIMRECVCARVCVYVCVCVCVGVLILTPIQVNFVEPFKLH